MPTYSPSQLGEDLLLTLLMAAAYSLIALLVLVAIGLASVYAVVKGGHPTLTLRTWLATLGVLVLGYFAAGSLSAIALFLTRPLRRWWLGWAVTGAVIAPIIYGTLFALLDAFYDPVGKLLLSRDGVPAAPESLAADLPVFLPAFALIGALAGLWWRRRQREVAA